jgi:hypothetical protein
MVQPKPKKDKWKYQRLVTWADSINFYIDIPSCSIIDVSNFSRGLTLGAKSPDVLLVAISGTEADTITKGDYPSLAAKFKEEKTFLFKTHLLLRQQVIKILVKIVQ